MPARKTRRPARPLNRESVESYQAEPKQYEVPDPKCPGLYLRVMPSGAKSWTFRWSRGNFDKRLCIGRWPSTTVEQARVRAGALQSRRGGGEDPAEVQKAKQTSGTTITDLAERFRREHFPRIKPRTIQDYEWLLEKWILPALGGVRVAELSRDQVAAWHSSNGRAKRTANHALAVLSKMLSLSIRWGMRENNPCQGQERYRETKRQRYLDPVELASVVAAIGRLERSGEITAASSTALRLLLLTGARRSEIRGLLWDDVDPSGSAKLRYHKTIGRGERVVMLPPEASKILKRLVHHDDNPHVFAGQGDDGTIGSTLDCAWRIVRASAGVPDVRLHDLRHTYASMGVASGLTLAQVGQLLGHSTPATTQRYAHLVKDEAKKAAVKAAAKVTAAMRKR